MCPLRQTRHASLVICTGVLIMPVLERGAYVSYTTAMPDPAKEIQTDGQQTAIQKVLLHADQILASADDIPVGEHDVALGPGHAAYMFPHFIAPDRVYQVGAVKDTPRLGVVDLNQVPLMDAYIHNPMIHTDLQADIPAREFLMVTLVAALRTLEDSFIRFGELAKLTKDHDMSKITASLHTMRKEKLIQTLKKVRAFADKERGSLTEGVATQRMQQSLEDVAALSTKYLSG